MTGKRGAKDKLPLLVHCVWSLYCSGFVWRFFLFRCYLLQCRARPVECKQRDLGNDMPSYCVTQKPSTSPSPLLGIFSPFFFFPFYLLREIARRSAVAAPSPFFYSTHTCMYLLTCYRYRCRNLPRRLRCKTAIQVHQELRFTMKNVAMRMRS